MRAQRPGPGTLRCSPAWLLAALTIASPAMAIDLDALWDFSKPALSEERFRSALAGASGDDALILQTQIARTWGLRRDFERARAILAEVERAGFEIAELKLVRLSPAEARRFYAVHEEIGRAHV